MLKSGSLFQLGTDWDGGADDLSEAPAASSCTAVPEERKDFFQVRDGEAFAGTHLIVDLWDAQGIDDLQNVEEALRKSVEAAGATLLHIHLHHFTPNFGVSGVAVLAESHISIHSWPECGYAALDLFMCGDADPRKAIPVLSEAFGTTNIKVEELRRGRVEG